MKSTFASSEVIEVRGVNGSLGRMYPTKAFESNRLSARFTHELQHQMEQTFKAMAEREEEGEAEISHMSFSKKNDVV